jgi:hypothetical protein
MLSEMTRVYVARASVTGADKAVPVPYWSTRAVSSWVTPLSAVTGKVVTLDGFGAAG